MTIELLKKLIEKGFSTHKIAEKTGKSQTTIRYWLKKYKLKTINPSFKESKNAENGLICQNENCNKKLTGLQRKYCSTKCKNACYSYSSYKSQKQRSKDRKIKLIKMSGGECEICGYKKNYAALCFHHKKEEKKEFALDARKISNSKWQDLLKEWRKCSLLCHNCHMETHYPNCEF